MTAKLPDAETRTTQRQESTYAIGVLMQAVRNCSAMIAQPRKNAPMNNNGVLH
jgi:hypothetical protein